MAINIPSTPEILAISRRILWFEEPEVALANPIRFVAYAMRYATHQDISIIRRFVDDDALKEVLLNAPLGIIDPRSWAYWHVKMGIFPPPLMPERRFE
jgi:hypothetical protein